MNTPTGRELRATERARRASFHTQLDEALSENLSLRQEINDLVMNNNILRFEQRELRSLAEKMNRQMMETDTCLNLANANAAGVAITMQEAEASAAAAADARMETLRQLDAHEWGINREYRGENEDPE